MPLPTGGQWPPKELDPVLDRIGAWSAWYSGDPNELSGIYGGQRGYDPTGTGFYASESGRQPRGGVVGWFQRWFWGQQTPSGERSTKLHLPVAGDIASTSSDLLFSEPPRISLDGASTATADRLAELTGDGLHATLLEGAEVCAGLGGVYLRIMWDEDVSPMPWIAPVHADAAVPEWHYGRLSAVTFWRVVAANDNVITRHLERHEPGMILHGLYVGDRDTLGRRVPLTEHADTTALAEAVADGDVVYTEVPTLTAAYVPNMRPNRLWRNTPAGVHLGRSDYAGIEPAMDSLDECWTSWMRDIRLGKARLIVPELYLESNGPGRGASVDLDREVYQALNVLPGNDGGLAISAQQFAIRVEEHKATAEQLLGEILRGAGYASQTFGEVADGAVTATEVRARERRSYRTRDRKILYWRPELQAMLETLMAIDAVKFGSGIEPGRPIIEFGDAVNEDQAVLASTAELLRRAEAASTETLVRIVHPDWDDVQVGEEVALIKDESALTDPITLQGPGKPQPGEQEPEEPEQPVEDDQGTE